MISRLSTIAAILATLASVSLAFAANSHLAGSQASAKQIPVVQLETVVVTGKRAASAPR